MKKLFTLLTMLIVAISASWAEGELTSPYSITFDNNTDGTGGVMAANKSVSTDAAGAVATGDAIKATWTLAVTNSAALAKNSNGLKIGNGTSVGKATFSTTSFSSFKITKVVVKVKNNTSSNSGKAMETTTSVKVGGVSLATDKKITNSNSATDLTFESEEGLVGSNLTVEVENTGEYENHFYVKTITVTFESAGPVAPSISADDVEITNAATEDGEIAFTVNNPVAGGAISATNYSEASWLTVGTETTSPISFTATANTGAERSATVRLTYTYNTNETVTKDVTITQAAAKYAITYNKGEYGTGTIDAGEKSYGVDFTLSSSTFTREGYAQTGWAETDGGDKAYDLGGTYSANAAIELFPVWTAKATDITVTFANGDGAEGVVPAALTDQTEGTEITLPKNFTMYKEGYTLTGWKIGDDVYAPGASYTVPAEDVTLTADYTPNTKSLANHTAAVTVKWGPWNQSAGVPVVQVQGNSTFVVTQADVDGESIDVKLPINATNGKFWNNETNTWTQVEPGTIFSIPAEEGATITYKQYDNGTTSTPEATATGATYELTAEGTSSQLYYEYIQVVFPKVTITPEAGAIFKLNMTYTGSDKNVTHGTETALGTYGTATSGCDVVIGNKHASDDSKARITSSGVYFNGNDAYIKVDFNFNLKTGDVITFTSSNDKQICFTTTNTRSDSEKTVSNSYTVGSALNGASTIYVWRAETSATYAKTLTISRPITLNASGYATFSKSTDFEFSGATAYKMALNEDAKTITGTAVTGKIAAGEGILFKGEANAKVSITETTGATALEGNSLKGTTTASGKATVPTYCYTLSGNTFKKFKGAAFNDNKAYLESTQDLSGQSLEIIFDDQPTAISFVVEDDANVAVAPVKTIKNGQLFIGNYNVAGARIK